jgi:hypothetical protein
MKGLNSIWEIQAVSVDGDTVVVGAPGPVVTSSGSAYVFERNLGGADNWGQQPKLTAFDAAVGDEFGRSVSVSGDTMVAGARRDDDAGSQSGSAYIFVRSGGIWSQEAKLTASDAAFDDVFGDSVSVSGDTAVIGATQDDDAGSNSGSTYVFVRSGGTWTEQAKLTASDAAFSDKFGQAVSVSEDTALVGSHQDDDAGSKSGSAYVFERNQGGADNWGQVKKLTASDAATTDQFGFSVSVSGDTALVGAIRDDHTVSNPGCFPCPGSAYIFSALPPVDLNI